jgi:hypothetical protein
MADIWQAYKICEHVQSGYEDACTGRQAGRLGISGSSSREQAHKQLSASYASFCQCPATLPSTVLSCSLLLTTSRVYILIAYAWAHHCARDAAAAAMLLQLLLLTCCASACTCSNGFSSSLGVRCSRRPMSTCAAASSRQHQRAAQLKRQHALQIMQGGCCSVMQHPAVCRS